MYKIRGKTTKHVPSAHDANKNNVPKYTNKFDVLNSDSEPDPDSQPVAESVVEPVVKERFADLPEHVKPTERPFRKHYKPKDEADWDAPKRKEKQYYDFVPKVIVADDEKDDDVDDPKGNKMFLASRWKVWTHRSDSLVWDEASYVNIFTIDSIGTMWRFLNNFYLLDKHANQIFIMRNQIKPMWEHNENRCGGICSIKLDCYSRQGKMDIGSEVMMCLCLLIMNETLIPSGGEINGISYSIKNKCVLIKIWYKDYKSNITDKLPISFFNKLDMIMRNTIKSSYGGKKNEKMISIQCKPIKPEFELQ